MPVNYTPPLPEQLLPVAGAVLGTAAARIKNDVVKYVLTVQVRSQQDVQAVEDAPAVSNVRYQHADYEEALAAANAESAPAAAPAPFTRVGPKVGRNDPCPCGSGKKFKHCHGRI